MTNKTFEPVGLLEITKQLADSAQAHVDRGRKQVADLEDRLRSALDAKRDAASAMSDELQEVMKRNQAMWQSGYEAGIENGERKGYDEGYKAGRESEMKQSSEQRDRDLLESHGIDVDGFCDKMVKLVEDHEPDIDEDEPDQYQPEQEKWGGTK